MRVCRRDLSPHYHIRKAVDNACLRWPKKYHSQDMIKWDQKCGGKSGRNGQRDPRTCLTGAGVGGWGLPLSADAFKI